MAPAPRTVGRPRTFDEDETVDRVVDILWCRGAAGTTTRVLETELGLTQSSIYNAFGSKNDLLLRAVDRYNTRINDAIVVPLDDPEAGEEALLAFIDAVYDWVTAAEHPGCLLLNMLGQKGTSDPELVERARAYRQRIRSALATVLDAMGVPRPESRAELLLAGLMGLNIAAYGGADVDELNELAESLRLQIGDWAA